MKEAQGRCVFSYNETTWL